MISMLLLLTAFLPNAGISSGQHVSQINAEIVSKRYSSGYFPVVGSYVEYELRLTNEGSNDVENQSLWILLKSEDNKTHSNAIYSIPVISAHSSKILHLGPFKMEGEGSHQLLSGMRGMAFDYRPDSFTVYRNDVISTLSVGIPLIMAGAGLVIFSLFWKRKRNIV